MPVDWGQLGQHLIGTLRANQKESDAESQLALERQKQQFSQGAQANQFGLDKNYLDFQMQQAAAKQQKAQQLGQAAVADLTQRWDSATDPAVKSDLAARIRYVASGGDPNRALEGIKSPVPAKPERPVKPSIDTEYEGDKGSRVARDPTTGAVLWRSSAGSLKPSAEALKADREARMAAGIAQAIPELASKIDPNNLGKLASQAKLYSMSGNPVEYYLASRVTGPLDNNYANLFSQIGQLDAALTRAYTGGRISAQVYQRLHPHFPAPGDPPELLADKVRSLLGPKGVLQQEHDAIAQLAGGDLGGPLEISPPSGAGAPAARGSSRPRKPSVPRPPFDVERIDTSGKYVQGYARDGSVWFVNPNSGNWEPLD